ncbi:PST family polysaccharide transporter [Roseinatronobacter thiooxidans]|uniref:PST family polysaccharide transporter n=1 Tax=Roseinatronobacter thiooxidans TaxID=121821 RepID=A0A2W7QAV5_9RHOB|nr:lipopolysaccharide biosynthesis protein [Roseinatronobacter thiooxidans]PZX41197.1 PST family polysaccharide transporter [Roseinatronobacter thiooxidans]
MHTALSQAVLLATQIGSVVVLSRLLSPGDFGLIAMCVPILALVGMMQNFGLLQATVQRPNILQEEVSFLFWVNIAASVTLAAALFLTAPLIASFYGDSRVGPLVAALSLIVVTSGAAAQHGAILQRRMHFGRLAVISVIGAVSAFGVATLWALFRPDYWAVFAGMVAGTLVPTVLTWVSAAWLPDRPRWVPQGRALLGFGAGVTGFNLSSFVTHNSDNVLIGRAWGVVELGLYDRAYKLLLFPLRQITNPLDRVMIPSLSRLLNEPHRYRSAYLRVLRLVLFLALPGVACTIALADVVISLALGAQWHASAPIFQALGFAGLLRMLSGSSGWLFISQGRTQDYVLWGMVMAALAVTAYVIGLPYGAFGVAVALSVAHYVMAPVLWVWLCRKGPVSLRDIVTSAGPLMLAGHLAVAGVWLARPLLPDPPVLTLLAGAALSYALTALLISAFPSGRATLREGWELLAPVLRRIKPRPANVTPPPS